MTRATLELTSGGSRRVLWSRKNEEFMADFTLIAKRTLSPEEYRIFRFHHLLGADWRLCCRRLNMDRGAFFHAVYRVEQKLGAAFRETEPYPLYPLSEYFESHRRHVSVMPSPVVEFRPNRLSDRVPVRKAA